ncbi:DUF3883 domain-containing protein [Paenibacillus sp. 1781tsa1]|uniref:DUF3883 domain-containing protein n=1 Tax=Paenibacillus sp. 1781tsa1 TaxID=2953810 RepID=UPI00209E41EE|nr:DUF3883 domain-containing protein [Paenibacillus sp. 1781tsa1]MCP1187466.1 DUF3883 domain-containing protein [Paenibacillus sp. 1781tsa1]
MLTDLKHYDNLGTFEEIKYVLTILISEEPKKISDIEKFCQRNTVSYNMPLKGIMMLLSFISLVSFYEEEVFLNHEGSKLKVSMQDNFLQEMFIKKILSKIIFSEEYKDFLNIESFNYDIVHEAYIVRNNEIPLKYSGIRNLLINLEFFKFSTQVRNLLVIDNIYSEFLIEVIKPISRKLSIEKFKEIQLQKEKYGEEAEAYILSYEKKRLAGHKTCSKIVQVSKIDVNAGYDIVSYNSLDSVYLDRFIEVKSYSRNQGFYWTRNEIAVSLKKKSNYFLYLVDRDKMDQEKYRPLIIPNPYEDIFENQNWKREAQSWFFFNEGEL